MSILKKLWNDEPEDYSEEDNIVPAGYQDPDEPEDLSRPKPQFVLVKPERRDELMEIADHLLNRKTVIPVSYTL